MIGFLSLPPTEQRWSDQTQCLVMAAGPNGSGCLFSGGKQAGYLWSEEQRGRRDRGAGEEAELLHHICYRHINNTDATCDMH